MLDESKFAMTKQCAINGNSNDQTMRDEWKWEMTEQCVMSGN